MAIELFRDIRQLAEAENINDPENLALRRNLNQALAGYPEVWHRLEGVDIPKAVVSAGMTESADLMSGLKLGLEDSLGLEKGQNEHLKLAAEFGLDLPSAVVYDANGKPVGLGVYLYSEQRDTEGEVMIIGQDKTVIQMWGGKYMDLSDTVDVKSILEREMRFRVGQVKAMDEVLGEAGSEMEAGERTKLNRTMDATKLKDWVADGYDLAGMAKENGVPEAVDMANSGSPVLKVAAELELDDPEQVVTSKEGRFFARKETRWGQGIRLTRKEDVGGLGRNKGGFLLINEHGAWLINKGSDSDKAAFYRLAPYQAIQEMVSEDGWRRGTEKLAGDKAQRVKDSVEYQEHLNNVFGKLGDE